MTPTPAEPVRPTEIARVLNEIAELGELSGMGTFRVRAFRNAARQLEGTEADLEALAREGKLTTLEGIGAGLAGVIEELVLTGRSSVHDELRTATPVGLFDLMKIPGLGNKRLRALHRELGVETLDELEAAAREGRVAELPGFGVKTEASILAGIPFARSSRERRRFPEALRAAGSVLAALTARDDVEEATVAGAIRRRMEVVDRVDLLAASFSPAGVLAGFRELNGVSPIPGDGLPDDVAEGRFSDGLHVRLRCVPPPAFVGALVDETGSDAHLAELARRAERHGMELRRDGLWRGEKRQEPGDEHAFYQALGFQYVPPELREGLNELALAASRSLPSLVEGTDLTGTFHCHTTYSDGRATIEEMADAARERGWSYLGLADHSRSAGYAGGLSIAAVHEQHEEIDRYNAAAGGAFRIFKGIESDILADGSLDYPAEVLHTFDYVVGSVHSGFRMTSEEMTERIVRAVRQPWLTILGHPTGRLLLRREGYEVDMEAVIAAAAERGVVIEINANPHRLDLDWREVRRAVAQGVLIAINPDAHSIRELDHVAFGVNMARKAGLEPRQVLNCWERDEIEDYLSQRRKAAET